MVPLRYPLMLLLAAALSMTTLMTPTAAQESAVEPAAEPTLADETRALLDSLQATLAEVDELKAQIGTSQGEDRRVLEKRRFDKSMAALDELDQLIASVLELERQGQDAESFRQAAGSLVTLVADLARQRFGLIQGENADLESQRQGLAGEDLVKLEASITESAGLLDRILAVAADNLRRMQALGLESASWRQWLTEAVGERAEDMAARLELALEQRAMVQERLQAKPGDAELQSELGAVEAKRERATTSLNSTIGLMNELDLDPAGYQQLIIQSTGQITTDILDKDVALGLLARWMEHLREWFVESGPVLFFKTLVFLLILFVFHLLARIARRLVARAVKASRLEFSQLLQKMFVSTAGNAVWAIGILVALSQLGFALGPVLAGFGIAGFIVGFALQETLANFAAGMMILIYRPFDVGDLIEAAGVFGKVSAMSMVSTTILTLDNQTLVVPNGKIWGDVIKNVTHQEVRRVDMTFGVSYADDITRVEKVLAAIIAEHPKVLEEPAPTIKLHTLGESSVDFVVRPWVKTADYWDVYWDVTREVKMRFDREGISIPFPQRDVHFYEERRRAAPESR